MLRLLVLLLATAPVLALEPVQLSAAHPRDAKKTCTLRIGQLDAEVTLRGVLAETVATLTLAVDADPGERMEGRLVFSLPPHCTVTGAALDIGDIMRPASVTFKETAKRAYDAVVSRMLDPCLVQLLPDGRVSVQVFPFTGGKPRKVRLEFAHQLTPGGQWEFPLRFADPVVAHLTTDAPFLREEIKRQDFRGDEWKLAVPEGDGGQLLAQSDGRGGFVFQKLLPAPAPSGPPRHLLVLAEVSLMQARRNAAAERALLERLFQSMGEGRVTLVTFSTAEHSRAEFAVQDGKCEALPAALAAMEYDGAPRPGAVDVSGIPADLTLVLSTLSAPMGGGRVPALPRRAPVWVADSISSAPSLEAERLAEAAGGRAFDPRQPVELVFHARPAMEARSVAGLTMRTLPGEVWRLITGRLEGETGLLTVDGRPHSIARGEDPAAGRLVANDMRREEFLRRVAQTRAAAGAGIPEEEVAPFLTEDTAFIVLEEEWQYVSYAIPLPPDLAGRSRTVTSRESGKADATEQAWREALQRPPGTAGEAGIWHQRLRGGGKWSRLLADRGHTGTFLNYRTPLSAIADRYGVKEEFLKLEAETVQARAALADLARSFQLAAPEARLELVERARGHQLARMTLMEFLESMVAVLRSGGAPGLDPFAGPVWMQDAGFLSHVRGEPFSSAGTDPFSGFGTRLGEPPGFQREREGEGIATGVRAVAAEVVVASAKELRLAGKKAEAIRALSVLAIRGQRDHALLRLLAWMLQEWGEHALALEVLAEAERRFGESETTLRDLGLACLTDGKREAALSYLQRARHPVSRREALLLQGKLSPPALRVVVECADAEADADLEVLGPDYELCDWRNPLPGFGGALSFDGTGVEPEDFVLPASPVAPLKVRVRLHSERAAPLRVTVVENRPGAGEQRRVFLLPAAVTGLVKEWEVSPD